MFKKEKALTTLCENACQGQFEKECFNIHEVLKKVKGGCEDFEKIYQNPFLTAGSLRFDTESEFDFKPFENFSVDKLVIILNGLSKGNKFLMQRFKYMLNHCPATGYQKGNFCGGNFKYRVTLFDEYCVQWHGEDDKKGSVRIEFNPNKANIENLKYILAPFEEYRIDNMRITRIDFAIDYFINLRPENFYTRNIVLQVDYKKHKKIETIDFGSGSSDNFIRVYNKKTEVKEKEKIVLPCAYMLRVESEFKKDWLFRDYLKLRSYNPFSKMLYADNKFYDLAPPGPFRNFLYVCLKEGFSIASDGYDSKVLGKYSKKLQEMNKNKSIVYFNMPQVIFDNCFAAVLKVLYDKIMSLYRTGLNQGVYLYDSVYNVEEKDYSAFLPNRA